MAARPKPTLYGTGSPAIDQGNATGLDQRGFPRVDHRFTVNPAGGNGSDIGAFERAIGPNAQILESWLLSHGLPADSDLNQDLNNDGVSLLMAYALDLDPASNLSGSMPVPVIDGDFMNLSFQGASELLVGELEYFGDRPPSGSPA